MVKTPLYIPKEICKGAVIHPGLSGLHNGKDILREEQERTGGGGWERGRKEAVKERGWIAQGPRRAVLLSDLACLTGLGPGSQRTQADFLGILSLGVFKNLHVLFMEKNK